MPETTDPAAIMKDYITTTGAARILGVSDIRARQLTNEGKLPCVRISTGQRLFKREDVEAFKQQREKQREEREAQNHNKRR